MKQVIWILGICALSSCNLFEEKYSLIYTDDPPNAEFAEKLEEVLEASYNVDIQLNKAENVGEIISSLESESVDMGLVENLVNVGEGIHTVVPIYPKALHLFHRKGLTPASIPELFHDRRVYIGRTGSAAYGFMMELFDYYHLDDSRIDISSNMLDAEVLALFSVIMDDQDLSAFSEYELYSIEDQGGGMGSQVQGIALKFPRVRPFVIPEGTYGSLTTEPVYTLSTDMVYVVREGMGKVAVNDLTASLFLHREQFVHVNPSFYFGIIEDFDRSKLSYSLHEGARSYLDRDQPGFFERYAELAGVVFTIVLALGSGLVSFGRKRRQKKKDKIDVFYEHLMQIKNQLPGISSVEMARTKIQEVKDQQDRAFKMLINEELEANDSFRIYMQLSKETIDDIRIRLRILKQKASGA